MLWLGMILFGFGMAIITYFCYKGVKGSADFLVAGRSAPWWLITGALIASTVSGATYMGMIGYYYKWGIATHFIPLGVLWSWIFMAYFIGPKLRAFAGITVADYLEERFDSRGLRSLFGVITVIWMTILMGSLSVQGALLLKTVFGVDYVTGAWATGLFVILYTALGGQRAALWTDFYQMLVLLIAAIILLPLMSIKAGGWDATVAAIKAAQPGYFTPTGGVLPLSVPLAWLLVWSIGYLGHPGFLTRFYTARSPKDCVLAGLATSLIYAPFWWIIFFSGAFLRVIYPAARDVEAVWLQFGKDFASPLLYGIALAGVIAAISSSATTWLITAGGSLARDVYQKLMNKEVSDKDLLRLSRIFVVIVGLLSMPVALKRPTYIMELMTIAYSIAGAAGGVLILTSIWWRSVTREAAWAGMIFGAAAAIVGRVLQAMKLTPTWFQPIIPVLAVTTVIVILVSLFTKPTPRMLETFDRLKEV